MDTTKNKPIGTFLIVEDTDSKRELLSATLQSAGHRVLEALTGEEGLTMAKKEIPDVAIVDVILPGMNGYKFVERLRQEESLRETRVIFNSSFLSREKMLQLARSFGSPVMPDSYNPEDILQVAESELLRKLDSHPPILDRVVELETISDEIDAIYKRLWPK